MSLQQYKEWYRMNGLRTAVALLDPEPVPLKNLPVGSTFHYLGSAEAPLPDASDPLFQGYGQRIELYSLTEYDNPTSPVGGKIMVTAQQQTLKFANQNAIFHHVKTLNVSAVSNQQLLVVNYGFLDLSYRYPAVPSAAYYRFRNKMETFVNTVRNLNREKLRNNFVILEIPKELVSRSTLDNYGLRKPRDLATIFDTEEKMVLREIWLWLNQDTRQFSVFGELSEEDLKTVNFMFRTFTGEYATISLGYMYSWIKGNKNLTSVGSVAPVSYVELQKYWLKQLMTLQSINATGASAAQEEQDLTDAALKATEGDKEASEENQGNRFLEPNPDGVPASARPGNDGKGDGVDSATSKAAAGDTLEAEINLAKQLEELDADIEALDKLDKKKIDNKFVVHDGPDGEELIDVKDVTPTLYTSEIPESAESISAKIFTAKSSKRALLDKINSSADEGRISVSDYRKLTAMAEKSDQIPDPFGSDKTLAAAMRLTEEELIITAPEAKLAVPPTVLDQSMAASTLNVLERKYNTSIIYKDVLRSVQAIQKAGIIVKNHEVETKYSELGAYDIHTIEIKPVNGQPSIIRARIPRVDEEGYFIAKGNKYVMRKQMVDRPIRRIGTNRVGLTSYYGKSFVDRATKKAESHLEFVFRRLNRGTIEPDNFLRDVAPGDVFDNYFEAPYIYNGLASKFRSFRAGEYLLNLNHKDREKAATPEVLKKLEVNGRRLIGQGPGARPLVVDTDNNFWLISPNEEKLVGDIFDILQLDRLNAPVDFAEVKVFSKSIPVGVFIAYNLGFRALVKYLNARHRLVEGRQQKKLQPYEYVVQFKDVAYIFDRRDKAAALALAGFRSFEKETKQYDAIEFDDKAVYMRLLEAKGLTSIYMKEMENLVDMFVDPITEDLLKELNEPQTFLGLLVRSCEMLDTFHHPASQDMNHQRFRGYERFAGFLYKEMANSVRAFKSKNTTGRAKVDMSPFAVWSAVTRDNSVKHAEDINPIQALKASEAVTYVGEGGRSKESMNKASRALHTSNLGVISVDASVDSSDVGINIFTSADPGISSVRGMGAKDRALGPANLMGTSAMLAPFASTDDPKRTAFVSIQQAHTVATTGYHAPVVRTGYESVIGQRTGEMFASAAREDGKVISVTDTGILVEYADGQQKGFALGTMYGRAEGSTYPHNLITDMKPGQKFKKGEYISYNTNFFEPDPILPGGVVYKGSMLTRVALIESSHTHEDSSTISEELSKSMTTTTAKVKKYAVNFRQNLLNVVRVGQQVNPEDIMMTIEDEITAMDDSFGEASLEILAARAKSSPTAGYRGTITNIDVVYHGDKADMSASLKALADRSDRRRSERSKSTGKPVVTGSVDSDYSHEGSPLLLNRAVITIYISVSEGAGVGDKLVFSNQLKSVIGEVMPYTLTTKSGLPVHAKFGAKSYAARIVNSMVTIGALGAALDALTDTAIAAYRKK